ncbi:hypothetical protein A2U01_0105605, partial [Trifolium medium]|nr:hypothetical protein [Trifolium medium]
GPFEKILDVCYGESGWDSMKSFGSQEDAANVEWWNRQ